MENLNEPQAMNDEQYLRELRQRINAKAEISISRRYATHKKWRWIGIAVLVAIFVEIEVLAYHGDNFKDNNVWLGVFIVVCSMVYLILFMIKRLFVTKMKNAISAPQHYRAAKQLINTHKLQQWLPLIVGYICTQFFTNGLESLASAIGVGSILTLGPILGALMQNWNIDDEFYDDVIELGNYE